MSLFLSAPSRAEDKNERPIVFAASSLTSILPELAQKWSKVSGNPVPRLAFGASATMARQIRAGAPAHLFISANPHWTELLVQEHRVVRIANIASNRLVLVIPRGAAGNLAFKPSASGFNLLLKGRRLALADPATAPAGAYARTFLMNATVWRALEGQIAYTQNVRQALLLAERGGLPAFVYNSDAKSSSQVDILYAVPPEMSGTILYQAALLEPANAASEEFLTFLQAKSVVPLWEKYGFSKIASN
jgi:molybdate transport system substrate-binding protein